MSAEDAAISGMAYDAVISGMAYDAVLRNIAVIGEAASALPNEFKTSRAGVPWPAIAGMRNIVVHEHFRVDRDVIPDIIDTRLSAVAEWLHKDSRLTTAMCAPMCEPGQLYRGSQRLLGRDPCSGESGLGVQVRGGSGFLTGHCGCVSTGCSRPK
ncbi:HepT-like ribonuclease domain-containing protein [Microbacterium sp.]|uniref:HepT-like ribonuclease domain-containing protein n=1 Tax=Microbacterium sp. TaxID=51671 RepID=UPI0025F39217|nr:HepT-like ribonuclease domain-containing protein [Microbacterium sp.]